MRERLRVQASMTVVALLFFLVTDLLTAGPIDAQHSGGCACGSPATQPLIFELDVDPNFRDATLSELGRWDTYARVFQRFNDDGNLLGGRNGESEIIAFFDSEQTFAIWGVQIDSNVLGVTFIDPQIAFGFPGFNECPPPEGTLCGNFQELDVVIALEPAWTTALPNLNSIGPNYFNATMLHELGHALGLHHNFNNLSTMNYIEDFAGRYLSLADAQILRTHYPQLVNAVTDIATYPFRYSEFQAGGTFVAFPDSSSIQPGGTFILSDFSMENIGTEALSNVQLNIYLSSDETLLADDYLVGSLTFPNVAPNSFFDSTGTTLRVPDSVPPGTYFIGAIVFHNTNQQDSISYNNTWVLDPSRRITVTATSPPPNGGGKLINLSTRGAVGTGDEVMIGGFVIDGGPRMVLVRAPGPSLAARGVSGVLGDPTLELFTGSTSIAFNDDWQDSSQAAAIAASGRAPDNALEPALLVTLNPGAYTAIVRGFENATGVALVEVYD